MRILHIARNTPKKVAFLLRTNFSYVFHNRFNNFVIENFSMWYYAYSGMLEFPEQVLELSMPVGRRTKGHPTPPVDSGMDW